MRHRRMLAPINTIKHFVPRTATNTAAGAIAALVVIDAVVAPASSNTFDVNEGAIIKAVWIEFWIANTEASGAGNTQATAIVEKVPSNQASVTASQIVNLQAYPNKKNILFTFQGVITPSAAGAGSMSVLRQWLLIPKGKQRFGLGDRLVLSFHPVIDAVTSCGMFIYKEYR